jgi:hypothetical protein
MQVFDRVFDRDHVRGASGIDVVDHRRQRRRLTATGGAGDQHQAAFLGGDLLEHRRQAELVEIHHLDRNDAEHQADRAALLEDVAAEAAEAGDAVGQVHFLRVLELLPLRRRHDRRRHLHEVLVIELLLVADRRQVPVDAGHGIAADLEVQVGSAFFDGGLQ